MRVGLQIPRFNWPGSLQNTGTKLAEIARTAEDAGFYSLWVMDHFFQVEQGYDPCTDSMLEGHTTVSYPAALTKRVKLGLMVTGNPCRHLGIVIKTVTTLDVISGGRAYLGIGTGSYVQEAMSLGVPFPHSKRELVERLEETLRIAKHKWKGGQSSFSARADFYNPLETTREDNSSLDFYGILEKTKTHCRYSQLLTIEPDGTLDSSKFDSFLKALLSLRQGASAL